MPTAHENAIHHSAAEHYRAAAHHFEATAKVKDKIDTKALDTHLAFCHQLI